MMTIEAMVLAAGRGERLRPLTDATPKPLIPLIGGVTPLELALRRCREAGARRVVVNVHHLAERLLEALPAVAARAGVTVVPSVEEAILGTAGGIRKALDDGLLTGALPLLVTNADILTDVAAAPLLALLRSADAPAVLAVVAARGVSPSELGIDGEGRIVRFPGLADLGVPAVANLVFTGVQVIAPGTLAEIPPPGHSSLAADFYKKLLAAGADLRVFLHPGYWRDLGTHGDLAAARVDLAGGVLRLPE
jgi:NDP-sugar pyrophosphorylase family protein